MISQIQLAVAVSCWCSVCLVLDAFFVCLWGVWSSFHLCILEGSCWISLCQGYWLASCQGFSSLACKVREGLVNNWEASPELLSCLKGLFFPSVSLSYWFHQIFTFMRSEGIHLFRHSSPSNDFRPVIDIYHGEAFCKGLMWRFRWKLTQLIIGTWFFFSCWSQEDWSTFWMTNC